MRNLRVQHSRKFYS